MLGGLRPFPSSPAAGRTPSSPSAVREAHALGVTSPTVIGRPEAVKTWLPTLEAAGAASLICVCFSSSVPRQPRSRPFSSAGHPNPPFNKDQTGAGSGQCPPSSAALYRVEICVDSPRDRLMRTEATKSGLQTPWEAWRLVPDPPLLRLSRVSELTRCERFYAPSTVLKVVCALTHFLLARTCRVGDHCRPSLQIGEPRHREVT